MKIEKTIPTFFIMIAFMLLVLPTAAYADRDITNIFNTQNVFAEAYNCLDSGCDTVGTFSGSFPNGKTTTNGQITIRYPTTLATHGYAVYFFSQGYIPKAYHDTFYGTAPPEIYSVEFHQKDVCSSTIESFTVTNDEHAEVPLVINTQANLDATFHSAFYEKDNGVGYIPDAYKDDYYSFDTHVTLEIYKGTTEVYTDTKEYTKNPSDDGAPLFLGTSQDVEFTWTPTTDGTYTAIVTTKVVDDVCLSSLSPYSQADFSVLEALPRNECYTILSDLTNSNPYPIIGDEQTAQFGKISNHANDYVYSNPSYTLTPVSTAITYTVKDSTDAIVTTETVSIIANSQPLTPEYYTFTWTPTDSGMHSIIVTGFSGADMCTNLENTPDQISMGLNVDPIPTYSVNFQISADSSPLENVLIEMDSKSGTTDTDGNVTLSGFTSGTYTYTASKTGYNTVTGDVEIVDINKELAFSMYITNTAPIVSGLPDKTLVQDSSDSTIDLDNYVTDSTDADSTLTWTYTGNSNIGVSIDPTTHILTLTAPQSWTGSEDITFTATDPKGLSDSDTLKVTVTASNTAPTLNPLPDQNLDEDNHIFDAFNLNDYASDTETPDSGLTYTITGNTNPSVGVSIDSSDMIDIQPSTNWYGYSDITIQVNDGEFTDTDTFRITVTSVNDAPEITGVPTTISIKVNTIYTIDLTQFEYDEEDSNAELIWTITGIDTSLYTATIDSEDLLTITPQTDMVGSDIATLTLTDSGGLTDTQEITINISEEPNTAPSISGLPDRSLDEDSHIDNAIYLKNHASDAETPDSNLTYAITGISNSNAGVSIDIYNNIDIYPITNWYGTSIVTVQVTDEGGLTDTDSFIITVTPEKDAPIISVPLPDLTLIEGASDSSIDLDNHFSDPDGDILYYSSTEPNHATVYIDPYTNIVTIIAGTGWTGTEDITFTADDGFLTASDTLTLTITAAFVNHAPIAYLITTETDEDTEKAITLNATDEDNDPLTYSIVSNPAHGTVSITGDTATYTPDADYNGPDAFYYWAYDSTEYSNTAIVSITVNPINDAPTISCLPDQSLDEDSHIDNAIYLKDHACDAETPDSNLTYTITGNTNPNVGVSIDIYNNIDIYPVTNWYGTSTVTIQVTDEDGLTDTDTFVITVTPEKDAPIISEPLPDLTLDEGASDSSIDLDNHFSDPDGDALSYTSTAPAHATVAIDPITHIVTITAGTGWAGTEDITFTADDGFLTVSDTMTLTITTTSANHAPIAHDINTETDEDTEKAITLNATDEDGDPLTYSIVSTHGTISITGDTATYTPDADYNGPDSFTYKAYDGTEYSNTATVFITVNPINDAPVISTPLPDLTVMEGTSDSSIDLDNHFSDPDNDILSYTSTALNHATVYINPYTHVITVTALPGWTGTEDITFTADDGSLTVSDTMTLTISIYDETIPVINSIVLDDYTVNPSQTIHVTVNTTDDIGIVSVTADGISLSNTATDIWEGDITAGSIAGAYSVNITITDTSSNTVTDLSAYYTVIDDNENPEAPGNLIAIAIDNETIRLSWTLSNSTDVEKYNIYYSLSSGSQNFSTPYLTVSNTTNIANITGLTESTQYFFVVEASDYVDNINRSDEANATTLAEGESNDPDGDRLPTDWENHYNQTGNLLDPYNNDSDDDGKTDDLEDPDNDRLNNYEEYILGTDPNNNDTDGDGMPDGWEVENGLNPVDPTDGALDSDGDGLSNEDEYLHGTDPNNSDTDGDGYTDGWEIENGTDPLDINDPTCHVNCGSSTRRSSGGSWTPPANITIVDNETEEIENATIYVSKIDIPDTAYIGQTITIKGCLIYPKSDNIELYIDNESISSHSLDEDDCFIIKYKVELEEGKHNFTIKQGNETLYSKDVIAYTYMFEISEEDPILEKGEPEQIRSPTGLLTWIKGSFEMILYLLILLIIITVYLKRDKLRTVIKK